MQDWQGLAGPHGAGFVGGLCAVLILALVGAAVLLLAVVGVIAILVETVLANRRHTIHLCDRETSGENRETSAHYLVKQHATYPLGKKSFKEKSKP